MTRRHASGGSPLNAKNFSITTGKPIADNYGVSCQTCQAVLEGYGFGGFFGSYLTGHEPCLHGAWYAISETAEECVYCHTTRERAPSAN